MTGQSYYQAQQAVLGSLLLDAPAVAGLVFHSARAEDFTGTWRTLFLACQDLFLAGKPIDPVTVRDVVGEGYTQTLLELMELTPTAANVEAYLDLCAAQSRLARLKDAAQELLAAPSLEAAQGPAADIGRALAGRPGVQVVSMDGGLFDFCERQKRPPKLLPWGLEPLDQALKAEWGGDFVVLGGYPSAGKTALSLQLAIHQAREHRVGYFSLETKPDKLIDRMVSALCGIDFGKIKDHTLGEEDWGAYALRADELSQRKLEVIQAGGLSVTDIQALTLSGRYEIVYIDYLQLIAPQDRRRSDVEQVTQISKDLHTMAQTTGVTVCALSQLSRPGKTGEMDKAPGLHSLRQSGQIEQDADAVVLLYKEEPNHPKSRRCLKIAKNKEGEAGGVKYLDFDGARQRFKVSWDPPSGQSSRPKREPEYRQVAFTEVDDPEPMPFEEEGGLAF